MRKIILSVIVATVTIANTKFTTSFAQDTYEPEPIASETVVKEDYSKKLIWLPIAYYTPETKLAGGVLLIKNLWKEKEGRTSNVMATASVTINNQVMTSISPRLYFDKGSWDLGGTIYYSYFPNKYYGRGVDNSLSTPEKYTENIFLLSANAGKNIYSHLFIRGGLGQDLRKIIDSEDGGLIQAETQLLTPSLQVFSGNVGLEWDERDYPQGPRQGSLYRVHQSFFDPKDREGNKSIDRFNKIDFDFRQYVTVAPRWVAAGQLMASEIQGDEVPFQYLNSIGGGSRMRGYYSGQYRDKAVGMFQTEVRYEKNDKWTYAGFAGIARMATKISDLNHADSFYSAGAGVHYTLDPENRTKLRLDVGFAGKETGAYFLIGEAF
ncbi:BamA/TamA family outer membrane protein [Bdellovibrio sp. HCB337]|uniref:BamA/TamA family outer membrane protein n=1 Tax=Bdellovibrio sp. HCB337 TaxID=3394358 RepID=UPI0039A729E4